jgi:hypothetical protein
MEYILRKLQQSEINYFNFMFSEFFQQMKSTQRAIEPLQDGILRFARSTATLEGNALREAEETLVILLIRLK